MLTLAVRTSDKKQINAPEQGSRRKERKCRMLTLLRFIQAFFPVLQYTQLRISMRTYLRSVLSPLRTWCQCLYFTTGSNIIIKVVDLAFLHKYKALGVRTMLVIYREYIY